MLEGALILLSGIVVGYSIHFWARPFNQKVYPFIKKLTGSDAKIVDMTPDVDLGE